MKNISVNQVTILHHLQTLLAIPSPTGMAEKAADYVISEAKKLGYTAITQTRRGHVRVRVEGKKKAPVRAMCSHLDTLGAMVAEVKADGTLRLDRIGGFAPRSAENTRVTIHARKPLRATLLMPNATAHSFPNTEMDAHKATWEDLLCRVDGDTKAAKVKVGDYVTFDTGYEENNGYIVSRFLDNKASAAIQLAILDTWKKNKTIPAVTTDFVFTVDEEVGFAGASMLADDVADCLVLDIAPVSKFNASDERSVTIAYKDGVGPYSKDFSDELLTLAEKANLPVRTDTYRFYVSDGTAAIKAGHDIRIALVGFGTHATHGYERTHVDALTATASLVNLWATT